MGEIGSWQGTGIFPTLSETAGAATVSLSLELLGVVRSSRKARGRLPQPTGWEFWACQSCLCTSGSHLAGLLV